MPNFVSRSNGDSQIHDVSRALFTFTGMQLTAAVVAVSRRAAGGLIEAEESVVEHPANKGLLGERSEVRNQHRRKIVSLFFCVQIALLPTESQTNKSLNCSSDTNVFIAFFSGRSVANCTQE